MATVALLLGAAPLLTYAAPLSTIPSSPIAPALVPISVPDSSDVPSSLLQQQTLHRKRSPDQIKYLNSMTGFTLHIWPNGTVNGVETSKNSTTSKYAMLEFITTMFTLMSNIYRTTPKSKRDNPRVEIRGVESRMWLCMNQSGALYGSQTKTSECEFYEEVDRRSSSNWNTYYSVRHPENTEKSVKWYIALNKRGHPRIAMTTKHRSSRFMTKNTHTPGEKPTLPSTIGIGGRTKGRKHKHRYNRRNGGRKLRDGDNKNTQSQELELLSIFDSIEANILSSKSGENFMDSMLIDIGDATLDILQDADDNHVRHPSAKVKSKRRRKYQRHEREDTSSLTHS